MDKCGQTSAPLRKFTGFAASITGIPAATALTFKSGIDRVIAETNSHPQPFAWIADPTRVLAAEGSKHSKSID